MSIADTIAEGIDAMRKVIQSARAVPALTRLPENPLKAVVNAAFVAAILVFANRSLMYPQTIGDLSKVGISVVVAAGALLFVFVISALICITRTDSMADGVADRWSVLFAFVWLITLLVFLVDQLVGSPIGYVIDKIAGGTIYGLDQGLIVRFLCYAIVAYCILLARTHVLEKHLFSARWSAVAFMIVVPVCVLMLYVFISFSH